MDIFMLTDFDEVTKALRKRLASGEGLSFYKGRELLTVRKFKLLTAEFVNEGNLEGNYLVKGRCSFEYQLGDGWASEGEKSVYETILQIDGDTIVSIGNINVSWLY